MQKIIRINKGYSDTGASYTRKNLKAFNSRSGSPNEDITYNLQTLRERSRMLCMSGGLGLAVLKTNRTNTIGFGLVLKSHIDKDVLGLTEEEAIEWQNQVEREFALWAENKNHCDAIGLNDFYKIQGLVFYSTLLNGDCPTVIQRSAGVTKMLPYSLRLNVVEADRLSTPNSMGSGQIRSTDGINSENGNIIFDGIEVDKVGKVVAYHICNHYKYELNTHDATNWERVEAYGKETGLPNVIFTQADVERPGQYRGLPILAPVIELLLQIRRYTEAELTAALIESMFTVFVKTNTRADENPLSSTIDGEESVVTNADTEYEMGAGNFVHLQPDEDIDFGDPKRPAGGFPQFVEAIATQIGASLEISKEILMKEFNSSYSASRAALLEFWKLVKMRREWFVSDFLRPVYEIWMYEAVARGRIKAPGFFDDPIIRQAWLGAEFIGPSQGMLDPTKEISAEQMMCENGFSSRADSAIRLNGSEYYKNTSALKHENMVLADTVPDANNEKETVLKPYNNISNRIKDNYINNIGGQGSA